MKALACRIGVARMQNEFPGGSMADRIIEAAVLYLDECLNDSIRLDVVAQRLGIEPDAVRSMYPDQDALEEAVALFGVMRLSDWLNRALVAAPEEPGGALAALAWSYLSWARENPRLYIIVTRPTEKNEIARRYDASFVPLICRFLGEDPQQPTRKLAIARALISGLTQLTLAGHFDLWMKQGGDLNTELRATIEAGVRMLLTMPIED